jgi:galactitol-specific phosphotransferase system IIC component
MTLLNQIVNLIIGLGLIVLIIIVIFSTALWITKKLNKND